MGGWLASVVGLNSWVSVCDWVGGGGRVWLDGWEAGWLGGWMAGWLDGCIAGWLHCIASHTVCGNHDQSIPTVVQGCLWRTGSRPG